MVVITVPAKKKELLRSHKLLWLDEFPEGFTPARNAETTCCDKRKRFLLLHIFQKYSCSHTFQSNTVSASVYDILKYLMINRIVALIEIAKIMTVSKQISEKPSYLSLVGQTGSPTHYIAQMTEQEVYMLNRSNKQSNVLKLPQIHRLYIFRKLTAVLYFNKYLM